MRINTELTILSCVCISVTQWYETKNTNKFSGLEVEVVDQNRCHKGKSNNSRTKKELLGLILYKGCANKLKMFIKILPPSGS